MFGKSKKQPKAISPAVQQIIKLLNDYPHDWKFDQYYAKHVGGAYVWIANKAWAAATYVPGAGEIIGKAENCKATPDHRALFAAVTAARIVMQDAAMSAYVTHTESAKQEKIRRLNEEARRHDYEAGTLRDAAKTADRLAAEKRARAGEAA
jgi:hypothetical protein